MSKYIYIYTVLQTDTLKHYSRTIIQCPTQMELYLFDLLTNITLDLHVNHPPPSLGRPRPKVGGMASPFSRVKQQQNFLVNDNKNKNLHDTLSRRTITITIIVIYIHINRQY